jgi:signal transduction histidine kinase
MTRVGCGLSSAIRPSRFVEILNMAELLSPSILYVDDDDTNRHTFTWVLEHAGFRTREATTGSDALRLAAEQPDLIILDVNLPDINGFEVCRRIKEHPATSAIPVLHMSAVFIRPEDKMHGLDGGADGYLTKPVEPTEVLATVKSMLRVRQAEAAARQAARQWQATFDSLHDALGLLDGRDHVARCNPALALLLRRPPDEVVGRSCRELFEKTFGGAGAILAARLGEGGSLQDYEVQLDGRWFRVCCNPVVEEDGEVSGRVLLLEDITPVRQLTEQLRQSQKMEAVGQLAGGVAHDFNNVLTAIIGNLSLLRTRAPLDATLSDLLSITEKAAWQAADLTQQLLGFSRRAELFLQPVRLDLCLEEALTILRRTFDPRIEIHVHADEDLWLVRADANHIKQVLINLCLNARDAMPEGGNLFVEMSKCRLTEEYAREHLEARAGEHVRLRVRDTGTGIPADVLPRIFDPFFTTKQHGRGTGLGLATVFGILKQHGGWIECRSTVGEGTTFDAYLPRVTDEAFGTAPEKERAAS